jgi:serine/threonine protein kinase
MNLEYVSDIALKFCSSQAGWGIPSFIDAGASAAVFSVEHPEYGLTALKIYDPAFFLGDNALIEEQRVKLQVKMIGLCHDNLIKILGAGECVDFSTWYVLMEFCPWKSLDKVVADFPTDRVAAIISQLADAVIFLEQNKLLHRDIKPANILISDDLQQIKLVDFGVIRPIGVGEGNGTDADEKRRFVATTQYSPPEFILREKTSDPAAAHKAINIYQIGAVLHDLIMRKPLFDEQAKSGNRYVLFEAIKNKVPTIIALGLPMRLGPICRASLSKDPVQRCAAVSLSDFMAQMDDVKKVKTRLAAQKERSVEVQVPSLNVWASKVEQWVAAAAISEKGILGPFEFPKRRTKGAQIWDLKFPEHHRSIIVSLDPVPSEASIRLSFASAAGDVSDVGVLDIGAGGPNIPDEQINDHLVEQLLYMLDSVSSECEASK